MSGASRWMRFCLSAYPSASDNLSIPQYATELENDFSVGLYTVAMHTAGTNQWPTIIYNDVVVVAANVRLPSSCCEPRSHR